MIRILTILPCVALALLPALALAASGPTARVEGFEVEQGRADVSLAVMLDLNETLRDAVDGGLEVAFRLEMDVVQDRWVIDRSLYGTSWTGSLRRRTYGQGYEYRRLGEEGWNDADSIEVALTGMRDFRFIFDDPELVKELPRQDIYVVHRVEVDIESLPNPIKVELLTTPGWDFSSGWLRTWH